MRRRPPAEPTYFRGLCQGMVVVLLAMPPDESDPLTDFLWKAQSAPDPDTGDDIFAGQFAGAGFTSHQAVHDLIERAEAAGALITDVIQMHEQ